jgi:hypothetical protein
VIGKPTFVLGKEANMTSLEAVKHKIIQVTELRIIRRIS